MNALEFIIDTEILPEGKEPAHTAQQYANKLLVQDLQAIMDGRDKPDRRELILSIGELVEVEPRVKVLVREFLALRRQKQTLAVIDKCDAIRTEMNLLAVPYPHPYWVWRSLMAACLPDVAAEAAKYAGEEAVIALIHPHLQEAVC